MTNSDSFNCILIGGDSLLAQCGDILLKQGNQIDVVVTSAPRIKQWAGERNIEIISAANEDYASELVRRKFDYLFAITHLALIPDAVVDAPEKLSINFHDGPLPAYAGLNTPMWAIMNGESTYGISWHVMTTGIDEGDLLLQQPIELSDDETAVSLNTKCFAAALESFPTLVSQLLTGTETRTPQQLEQRSYYGKFKKPPAACLLDWQKPAQELERMVRGLNTDRYENPVGTPKIFLGNNAFIVEEATALPEQNGHTVGSIANISESSFSVQTADGCLEIKTLHYLNGSTTSISDLIDLAPLKTGQNLTELELDREWITETVTRAARQETALTEKLSVMQNIDLPYRRENAHPDGGNFVSHTVNIDLPPEFASMVEEASETYTPASAFLMFLSRMASNENLSFAVAGMQSTQLPEEMQHIFATHGFLNLKLDGSVGASMQLNSLEQDFNQVLAEGPWLRDLVAREPILRTNPIFASRNPIPLAISLGSQINVDLASAELCLNLGEDGKLTLRYDSSAYSAQGIEQLIKHFRTFLNSIADTPKALVAELDVIDAAERETLINRWNDTSVDHDRTMLVHEAFTQQALETPENVALVFEDQQITYAELESRSNLVAQKLLKHGVGPDVLVGIHVSRSIELMVAALGVLRAGGAYVPLDPSFPSDRLEFMIADSAMPVIITETGLRDVLPTNDAEILEVDGHLSNALVAALPETTSNAENLAYVIYTSGSTGRPKGVMIEHRNVMNFFTAMDRCVPEGDPGVWMAVTSLSFDISVLELFWTLTRGFKVVIYDDSRTRSVRNTVSSEPQVANKLGLGLFMWGNDDASGPAKYRLLIEGAKYFDENGFAAVWTPERHFHAFGGPYPNPAVTGAAVATITKNLKIRAGSCVVPLHHPMRIAEEWSVVDNLSNGRVEIAAASGWNPNDFLLKPENHAENKKVMFEQLEQVRRLWRGEKLSFPGPLGTDIEAQSLPRPVQEELPCWITTAGNPETWRDAGTKGLHILTHLLGQTIDEVGEKIKIYREARSAAGHDPATGQIAMMLHTFVGDDNDTIREIVRKPMISYLASSMKLAMDFAWSFPAFKKPGGQDTKVEDVDMKSLSDEEVDTILNFAFERYFESSGLFGNVDTCFGMLSKCSEIGVSEIACLLDFGVDTDLVMDSLPKLKELKDRADASTAAIADAIEDAKPAQDFSFASQVRTNGVSHLQCTPSTARMFMTDYNAREGLSTIDHILVGGEALPLALGQELKALGSATLTNMYGPTETTIWSMTESIDQLEEGVSIGRPIANTQTYVLDKNRLPVPIGIPGELYVGGEGVARGYLNQQELTQERFVSDPFSEQQPNRMYATGDLVKLRADGSMDFLGRTDFQVKVRGYRIELGEIETQLESQTSVAEAAVVVRSEDDADQRLAAFVVCNVDNSLDTLELRSALREKLPEYMVPNEIFVLPHMPRTANGKLDRKALQSYKQEPDREIRSDEVPEGDTEKLLAELWQKTLKLDEIGVDENFFDLGGHSLLVVQLHGQLKESLSATVSLTDLYQYPTVRSLAGYLTRGSDDKSLQKGTSRGARRRALLSRRKAS